LDAVKTAETTTYRARWPGEQEKQACDKRRYGNEIFCQSYVYIIRFPWVKSQGLKWGLSIPLADGDMAIRQVKATHHVSRTRL
jgi:hypothetical protein